LARSIRLENRLLAAAQADESLPVTPRRPGNSAYATRIGSSKKHVSESTDRVAHNQIRRSLDRAMVSFDLFPDVTLAPEHRASFVSWVAF